MMISSPASQDVWIGFALILTEQKTLSNTALLACTWVLSEIDRQYIRLIYRRAFPRPQCMHTKEV
jgi:hypothetical protein